MLFFLLTAEDALRHLVINVGMGQNDHGHLIIMLGIYLYTFRDIFVRNGTFSMLVLQITFEFVPFKPISLKFKPHSIFIS